MIRTCQNSNKSLYCIITDGSCTTRIKIMTRILQLTFCYLQFVMYLLKVYALTYLISPNEIWKTKTENRDFDSVQSTLSNDQYLAKQKVPSCKHMKQRYASWICYTSILPNKHWHYKISWIYVPWLLVLHQYGLLDTLNTWN